MLMVQRTVKEIEKKRRVNLGCSAESILELVFCQTSWHNLRGLSVFLCHFTESKIRNEATGVVLLDLGLQRLLHPPWAQVSELHGRWGIKFHLRHCGVVSWKGAAALLDLRVCPSSSSAFHHSGVVRWLKESCFDLFHRFRAFTFRQIFIVVLCLKMPHSLLLPGCLKVVFVLTSGCY